MEILLEQSVKSAIASRSRCKVQKLRSKLNTPCLPPRKFPPPPPPHLNKPCVQQCVQPQSSNSWFALNIPYLPPKKFPPPLPPHTDKPCVQRLPCAHKLYTWPQSSMVQTQYPLSSSKKISVSISTNMCIASASKTTERLSWLGCMISLCAMDIHASCVVGTVHFACPCTMVIAEGMELCCVTRMLHSLCDQSFCNTKHAKLVWLCWRAFMRWRCGWTY